jgi:hypothetical protein
MYNTFTIAWVTAGPGCEDRRLREAVVRAATEELKREQLDMYEAVVTVK